jgi:Tol biopolymer transport system component
MNAEPEGGSSLPDGLSHRMVRTQLEKILASDMFCRSERLSAFLRFVVEETLQGNGNTLKEQVLAAAVYGKRVGFSGGDDATVRNDARRLRDKLREYYAESARDPIIVTLPKGAYTPTFEANAQFPLPTIVPMRAPEAPAMAKPRWPAAVLAAAGCLALAIGYWTWSRNDKPTSWNVEQVTSIPGFEGPPSLSPDGNSVAFSSEDPAHPGQSHIFIKAVRREALRRLTDSPDSDSNPAWSPDGADIAFVRQGKGVFRVSQLGGPERKIADRGNRVGWAPDGKSVLIRDRVDDRPFGISQVFLRNLDRRRLTQPSSGTGDFSFAVSPDGTTLAFTRFLRNGVSDVYVVPMSGGEPQRRTNWSCPMGNIIWAPGGRDLIYNVGYSYPLSLWRIPARGSRVERGQPVLLPTNANSPTISTPAPGQPARLAFLTIQADINLRLIDLEAPRSGAAFESVQALFDSTVVEYPGSFSHDGARIAFTSQRTGEPEAGDAPQLWVARRDNTGLRQLTKLRSPEVRAPSWSPDGRRIAFEASIDGNSDIFVIDADGGEPKRLTVEASIDSLPTWSQDGRQIFFSSDRSGRPPP